MLEDHWLLCAPVSPENPKFNYRAVRADGQDRTFDNWQDAIRFLSEDSSSAPDQATQDRTAPPS
jgi:hypothetical protein